MATNKRFASISEYQKLSGLSYKTIRHALESRQLNGIRTESGIWKIDTRFKGGSDVSTLLYKLENVERALLALCRQMNTEIKGG